MSLQRVKTTSSIDDDMKLPVKAPKPLFTKTVKASNCGAVRRTTTSTYSRLVLNKFFFLIILAFNIFYSYYLPGKSYKDSYFRSLIHSDRAPDSSSVTIRWTPQIRIR